MDRRVLGRLIRGLGANVYAQAITVVVQLLGVPLLLHAWGVQLYGEWLILFAIPVFLSMSDLGFSVSAANDMTGDIARGDVARALAVFQSLFVLVYAICALGLVAITIVILWAPVSWLHFAGMGEASIRWVLWLLSFEVFLRLVEAVTHAGFRASGDYALHTGLNSSTRLLQFGGLWAVALSGGGPVAGACAFLSVRFLTTPAFALFLVHRHPWVRFGTGHARRLEVSRLLRPAIASVAIPVAQAVNVQGMVLMIGAALGPSAVVTFSALRTLTRVPLQLVFAVSHAVEPEIAASYGSNNPALTQNLFIHGLRVGLWMALAAAASVAVVGTPVLAMWTGGQVEMNNVLFAWLLASAVFTVLWYGALIVLKAANKHLRVAVTYMVASLGAVALASILISLTGEAGYGGLALLVMDTTMAVASLTAASRLVGIKVMDSLLSAANPYPLLHLPLGRS